MLMLNQNLIKYAPSTSNASPSTSLEDDLKELGLTKNCFDLGLPLCILEPEVKEEEISDEKPIKQQSKHRQRVKGKSPAPEHYRTTKNIAKNYGKAIASFASSDLALPYLEEIAMNELCTVSEFINYMRHHKDSIQGIDSFRAMLLPKEEDSVKEVTFKRIFQHLSEIFIKFFSVNWIIHGKMRDKLVYLKFRHKILRRIQSPQLFTYVKKAKRKSQQG